MENNIPTAEEWIKKHYEEDVKNHFIGFSKRQSKEQTYIEYAKIYPLKKLDDVMIEFAKLHCEAQLKAILKNVKTKNIWGGNTGSEYCDTVVDRDSIINAYPLNNLI